MGGWPVGTEYKREETEIGLSLNSLLKCIWNKICFFIFSCLYYIQKTKSTRKIFSQISKGVFLCRKKVQFQFKTGIALVRPKGLVTKACDVILLTHSARLHVVLREMRRLPSPKSLCILSWFSYLHLHFIQSVKSFDITPTIKLQNQ